MSKTVFSLEPALTLELEVEEARFGLCAEDLFQLAVRQNPQRAFLFVSKVLGKHLPISPSSLLAAGKLLALAWIGQPDRHGWAEILKGHSAPPFLSLWNDLEHSRERLGLKDRTLFLGFAETATGLARAVADCFTGEMAYISTTRLESVGTSPLVFDDSHSHARTHRLYLDPQDPFMAACQQVVLVDDELTTGNTALRLIRQLHKAYGIRRFTLMALVDNSDGGNRRAIEQELGIEIRVVSLLHGHICGIQTGALPPLSLTDFRNTPGEPFDIRSLPGEPLADRTLQTSDALERQRSRCQSISAQLSLPPQGKHTLCLGTGEFIFAPALIAGFCGGCKFHSTTQSPVFPMSGSAIVSGVCFDPPDCYSPVGYLYNVPDGVYQEALLFVEEGVLRPAGLRQLAAYLKGKGMEKVTVIAL